jgi:phage tail-like protein
MAGNTRPHDPIPVFMFGLLIEGNAAVNQAASYFTEVSGIGSEHDVIENKVVDDTGHEKVQMIPGRIKWNQITLKRGITSDVQIWEWRKLVEDGKIVDARTNCSIVAYDRDYQVVAQWDFENAWPAKVSGPEFKADSSDFGVEEMTIVHEGFRRSK